MISRVKDRAEDQIKDQMNIYDYPEYLPEATNADLREKVQELLQVQIHLFPHGCNFIRISELVYEHGKTIQGGYQDISLKGNTAWLQGVFSLLRELYEQRIPVTFVMGGEDTLLKRLWQEGGCGCDI
ncbi:MAG: hypothetical protein ACK5MN_00445 [Lachnospiraceae bacterium]